MLTLMLSYGIEKCRNVILLRFSSTGAPYLLCSRMIQTHAAVMM